MNQINRSCPEQNIAAVVVTYNRKELLEQCIKRILNQQDFFCDVLVVDNASTDGTAQWVQRIQDSRVHYRNTGANLGGAGGFHFGLQWAVKAGYDYVWIMDDDCLPHEDALKAFWDVHTQLKGAYSYSYRNEVYLYRREGLPGWLWILGKYSYHSLQVLISPTDNKLGRIGVIWKGFFRGLRFHPEVEYVEALSTPNCGE